MAASRTRFGMVIWPPVAHQVVLESYHGKDLLGKLAQADPGMLDPVLGMLFRFDP